MKSGYLRTVSTFAMGSVALGAAMAKKADAQDAGYTLSFAGGWGEASGLNLDSGGFSAADPGNFGAIMISRSFGAIEGSVALSFYNQDSRQAGSGFSSPSGGGSQYTREFTEWTALDIMSTHQTPTPGFAWGFGLRAMDVEHGAAFGFEGNEIESGFSTNFAFEQGFRSKFVGLGPRVSAKFETVPMAGKFGFSGEAGLSALFGKHEQIFFGSGNVGGSGFSGESVESKDNFLANMDLTLQADYHLSDSAKMFAGVNVQQFFDFADEFGEGDVRTESVFIGFQTEF